MGTESSPAALPRSPRVERARTAAHVALLVAAVACCYANSLSVPFVMDDEPSIAWNPRIGSWDRAPTVEPATRRVAYLTLKADYRVWGLRPAGFHLTNLAIHLGAALAVYALARAALGAARGANRDPAAALAGALVFAVHPVQTQAVTYVIQRVASLATLFYVAALALYLLARSGSASPRARAAAWAGALASGLLAMWTKEIAFTLPFAILLVELAFVPSPPRRRLLAVAPFAALLPIIPLTVLSARASLAGTLAGLSGPAGLQGAVAGLGEAARVESSIPRLAYLATQARVVVTYLRLVLFPAGQNLDYDYPLEPGFGSLPVLGSAALIAGVLALGVAALRRGRSPGLRVAGAGLLLFLLGLAVESSVIPIADVIFEHRLYLPMAGVALALAGGSQATWERWPARRAWILAALGCWAIALGVATVRRNRVWQDPVTLWADAAAKSPAKARPHYNLGNALLARGYSDAAEREWSEAVRLDPRHSLALNQLGILAGRRGQLELAEQLFRRAVAGSPVNPDAHYNLGVLLESTGRSAEALPHYLRFLAYDPPEKAGEVEALRRRLGIPTASSDPAAAPAGR